MGLDNNLAVRIVAGVAKGRVLRAPRGADTRPTSDKVREALFSMIACRVDLAGASVLDLYAGSGALGLEALSRGAVRAVLVDRQAACRRAIEENVRSIGLAAACSVLCMEMEVDAALDELARAGDRFSLVLADPPYADDPAPLLGRVVELALLSDGGILALEHSSRREPGAASGVLDLLARRRHGDTALSLFAHAARR
jgi:16S rRNA (guanine966-N2)-methyltransferase